MNNYTLLNIIYQQKEALLGLSGDLDFRVKTMTEPFLLSLLLLTVLPKVDKGEKNQVGEKSVWSVVYESVTLNCKLFLD